MAAFSPRNYIFPIFDSKNVFRGTGFFVSPKGHFLTARHVVGDADRESFFIHIQVGAREHLQKFPVINLSFHQRADIAMGAIDSYGNLVDFFPLLWPMRLVGEDVYTFGFTEERIKTDRGEKLDARYLKGYISAISASNIGVNGKRFYELSFEVPRGLSGAPVLMFHNEVCIVGLIIGTHRSEEIEDFLEETIEENNNESKIIQKIINKKVISYGLAYTIIDIAELGNLEQIGRFVEKPNLKSI